MNLPVVAAEVTRRILLTRRHFRLVTSAATRLRPSVREVSLWGSLILISRPTLGAGPLGLVQSYSDLFRVVQT